MRGQKRTIVYKGHELVHDIFRGTRLVKRRGQPRFIAERGNVRDAKKYIDKLLTKNEKRKSKRS